MHSLGDGRTFFLARSPDAPNTGERDVSATRTRDEKGIVTYDDGVISEFRLFCSHCNQRGDTVLDSCVRDVWTLSIIIGCRVRLRVSPDQVTMQSPDLVIDALRQLANDPSPNDDPPTVHIRAGALFARLKALNREANAAARAHKQVTADARHDMDQTHLRLQNLLYEKRHLEREIEKCRQFAYVPLLPIAASFVHSPFFGCHSLLAQYTRTSRCTRSNNS